MAHTPYGYSQPIAPEPAPKAKKPTAAPAKGKTLATSKKAAKSKPAAPAVPPVE
jgi:hypothetical protein